MDEKDIDVSVSAGMLTMKGEKREEKKEKHKGYRMSERRFGSFQRSFSLPTGVETEKIAAEFSKGVLSLTLPKTEQAKRQTKKIPVKGK
jgi:HSP20 family protein